VRIPLALAFALAGLACGGADEPGRPGSPGAAIAATPAGAEVGAPSDTLTDTEWLALVEGLSEPGGYFDTDNLISNETGYLHVLGALRALGVTGGVYVGVGPDQSFSYMAQIRPRLAFLMDIRRDNLLQHLLFRALFERSGTRVEYLSLLHGRRPPADPGTYLDASADELIEWVAGAPGGPGSPEAAAAAQAIDRELDRLPIELPAEDRATLHRFHEEFIRFGPALRFTSYGRPPRPYYPTYAQLLTARDLDDERGSYVATEEDWRWLRELHLRNAVIPVVGDLAGEHALRAIGEETRRRGLRISAMYVSNVEHYLWREGGFPSFADNVASLPIAEPGALIRSHFPNFGQVHPHSVPGSYSTQTLQTLESFVRVAPGGGYRSYWDLVTRDALDPRPVPVG
jgi:hypothetical protein